MDADLKQLSLSLLCLVKYGKAHIPEIWAPWIEEHGVGYLKNDSDTFTAYDCWLNNVIDAHDLTDMLRRTMIRDFRYRFYLDLSISSILQNIGAGERWQRLENLLFGEFYSFSPKFVQIMELVADDLTKKPNNLVEHDWAEFKKKQNFNNGIYQEWDSQLWGECRVQTDLFSLLGKLYMPIVNQPAVITENSLSENSAKLMSNIINAAKQKEGCFVENLEALNELKLQGLSIRDVSDNHGRAIAYLTAKTCLVLNAEIGNTQSFTSVELEMPSACHDSLVVSRNEIVNKEPLTFWNADVKKIVPIAQDNSKSWSEVIDKKLSLLPDLQLLKRVGRPRRLSEEVDNALLKLTDHRVYGLIIQIFLLEALDCEMGGETLIFPSPKISDETGAYIQDQVLYRPPKKQSETEFKGFLLIGHLEDVFMQIGRTFNVKDISIPFITEYKWGEIINLMISAELLEMQHDRLTIAETLFDRLYGGTLMRDVIRRGKNCRDQIHNCLTGIWEKMDKSTKENS